MRRLSATCAALAVTAGAVLAVPTAAVAAPTDSATLTCGATTYTVTGFGRGQVLHVVDSNRRFVVVYARLEPEGTVVYDNPGQAGRADVVACSTTAPGGRDFFFRGFFTPRT